MERQRRKRRTSLQARRTFSEHIRKQAVKDIENGTCTVLEACRELGVSDTSVYAWLNRYSRYLKSNKQLIVEDKSEAYRSKQLQARIKDLEAALGRAHVKEELLEKLIELAGKELGMDLKKTFSDQLSSGSGVPKDSNTD
jgi:transposase-like protein